MKHTARFVFAAVLCAFAVWWYLRRSRESRPTPPPAPAATATGSAAPPASPPTAGSAVPAPAAPAEPPRFRRIDPAARQALLDRLAARRAGSATAGSGSAPAASPLPGQLLVDSVQEALMPLIPAFQDCYDETRDKRTATSVSVEYNLALVGDPEVGTLIDDIQLDGDDAFRADPEFATCLRETMLAIELPPLDQSTRAHLRTTLLFADEEPAPDAGP